MEKRYGALRTIGTIYKVLGIIAGILTLVGLVSFCAFSVLGGSALGSLARDFNPTLSTALGALGGGLLILLYGGGAAVTLYAFGEGIFLLIALEENTRATARMLQAQTRAAAAPAPQSEPPPAEA